MPTSHLTPHFTLDEFTRSATATRQGLANVPAGRSLDNLQRLAETLEEVRRILGDRPVLISSGYRSRVLNSKVGGAANSVHMDGLAADFTVPGFGTPLEVCRALLPHMAALRIDQLIHSVGRQGNAFVHLGLIEGDPRLMALTIDSRGTRSGFA